LEVLLQGGKAQATCFELRLQIFGNGGFFVLSCRNVECLHHEAGGSVTLEAIQHLLPNRSVLVAG
jgi:hypothetical protein